MRQSAALWALTGGNWFSKLIFNYLAFANIFNYFAEKLKLALLSGRAGGRSKPAFSFC